MTTPPVLRLSAALGSLALLVLVATLEAQPRSPAEGPWSGQAQCVVVATSADYLDEQTHTWTLTGAPPTPTPVGSAQAFFVWPATWSVRGSGQKTWRSTTSVPGREPSERWTITSDMSAPLRITQVTSSSDRVRITSESPRGAPLGTIRVTDASGRTRDGAVQPWAFPTIEDSAAKSPLTGTSTRTYPQGSGQGWGLPPQATTTAICTWNFTREVVAQISANPPIGGRGAASRPTSQIPAVPQTSVTPSSPASLPPTKQSAGAPASTGSAPAPGEGSAVLLGPSTGVTLSTAQPPGGAPVFGLRAQSSPTSVSLRWNCPSGASGFEVSGAPSGQDLVKLTSAPISATCLPDPALSPALVNNPGQLPIATQQTYSTGFTHNGLPTAKEYTYVVRALYPSGGPADSPPFITRSGLFPAPTEASAGEWLSGSVQIQWDRVWTPTSWEASAYVVARKLAGETSFRDIATVPAAISSTHRYVDSGVPAGRHEYTVRAVDGERTGVLTVMLGVPILREANLLNLAEVSLSWSAWGGATLRLVSSPLAAGPWTDVIPTLPSNTSWIRFLATPDTRTYYKVIATYPTITLESAPKLLEIAPWPALTNLRASTNGNFADLSWTCSPGVSEYRVIRVWNNGESYVYLPNIVYPALCNYSDRSIPMEIGSANVEYVVVGFDSKNNAARAGRVTP